MVNLFILSLEGVNFAVEKGYYYVVVPQFIFFIYVVNLYCLGFAGMVYNSSNLLKLLLNVELILLANGLNFAA